MNIASWLYQTARSHPDDAAVYEGHELLCSYGELLAQVIGFAERLRADHGIRAGDRVAVYARNCPEYITILHACWWIGAVAVPINNKLHPSEAAWIVDNAGASVVFSNEGSALAGTTAVTETALAGFADASSSDLAPLAVAPDDIAWLFYTSGTTGRPKGVMITHDNLAHMTFCYALDVDATTKRDAMLYAAPMSHGAGLYMFAAIRAGASHVVPASRGFDPEEIVALARGHGNLVFFAAPTMVKRLVTAANATGYDGQGIRTIIYGGGPMYLADIEEALARFGPRFVQIYGQGESPMTITVLSRDLVADTNHPAARLRRASVGVAQGCVQLRILGPDGAELEAGSTGEIAVRGPTVMRGYWQNPIATAEAIRDGWLLTGDMGHLDADGFLYLTDRSKDVIISGGTNIYPREVEEILLRHPGVFECSVVGVPDPEWGEKVVAFIVARPGATCSEADLDALCRTSIASFKKPKAYVFIEELPKNSYGKVLKTELRGALYTPH